MLADAPPQETKKTKLNYKSIIKCARIADVRVTEQTTAYGTKN
jgi:hypothetical protein